MRVLIICILIQHEKFMIVCSAECKLYWKALSISPWQLLHFIFVTSSTNNTITLLITRKQQSTDTNKTLLDICCSPVLFYDVFDSVFTTLYCY